MNIAELSIKKSVITWTLTVLVLVVGAVVARMVASFILKFFERKNFDPTLSKFIAKAIKITVIAFALIVALGKFGITIAPFIAALAAMAFGAGRLAYLQFVGPPVRASQRTPTPWSPVRST